MLILFACPRKSGWIDSMIAMLTRSRTRWSMRLHRKCSVYARHPEERSKDPSADGDALGIITDARSVPTCRHNVSDVVANSRLRLSPVLLAWHRSQEPREDRS